MKALAILILLMDPANDISTSGEFLHLSDVEVQRLGRAVIKVAGEMDLADPEHECAGTTATDLEWCVICLRHARINLGKPGTPSPRFDEWRMPSREYTEAAYRFNVELRQEVFDRGVKIEYAEATYLDARIEQWKLAKRYWDEPTYVAKRYAMIEYTNMVGITNFRDGKHPPIYPTEEFSRAYWGK